MEPVAPTSTQCLSVDVRGAARASIYLAAALYRGGSSIPVKIRNISATGALVEADTLPQAGESVDLARGRLTVRGLVAWTATGRFGVKFSAAIDVRQWRAASANRDQQRVDEAVRLVKAGVVPLPVPPLGRRRVEGDPVDLDADLPGDLRRISDLLGSLGNALSGEPDVVTRFGAELQALDIAAQMLRTMQSVAAGREHPQSANLTSLRRSLDQSCGRQAGTE